MKKPKISFYIDGRSQLRAHPQLVLMLEFNELEIAYVLAQMVDTNSLHGGLAICFSSNIVGRNGSYLVDCLRDDDILQRRRRLNQLSAEPNIPHWVFRLNQLFSWSLSIRIPRMFLKSLFDYVGKRYLRSGQQQLVSRIWSGGRQDEKIHRLVLQLTKTRPSSD